MILKLIIKINLFLMKKENIIYTSIFSSLLLVMYFSKFNNDLILSLVKPLFWVMIPMFIFSLITLFLKNYVFKVWIKFTLFFLLISIILILITPTSTHGMDFLPLVKETLSLLLTGFYSIMSLIIIVYKSLRTEA